MKECCSDYRDYLRSQKSVSRSALGSYTRDVEHSLEHVEQQNLQGPEQVTDSVMEEYAKVLNSCQYSASTVTRDMAPTRGFHQLLILTGEASDSPAKNIRFEKVQKKPPQTLSNEGIELLFAQPGISEPRGCHDKAMLELLYTTGIRVSELVDLNMININLHTAMPYCGGHGKNERMTPIYSKAIAAVSDYLFHVGSTMIRADGGQVLSTNLNGKHLTRQGFWKIIKGYAEQAKTTKEIIPHTLRYSLALYLLENGADLKDIQLMLGYADISSIQAYIQLMNGHFKEVYNHCHLKAELGVNQKEPTVRVI